LADSGVHSFHVPFTTLLGWSAEESSYWFRRLQTGLVQNYALLMLFGVVAFVGVYLLVR